MPRYTYGHSLFLSFFSRSLYREVCREWKGTAFLYLFLLTALCLVPFTVRMHRWMLEFFGGKNTKAIVAQVPEVRIVKGEVSLSEAQPYYLRSPEGGKPFGIIDTTGSITSLEGTGANFLLTRNSLLLKESEIVTKTYSLSDIDGVTVNQGMINNFLAGLKTWFVPLAYVFLVFFFCCWRMLLVFIYGGLGMIFCAFWKIRLEYPALVRLAVIALTPALVTGAVLDALNVSLPSWPLVSFVIAMGYLAFGITSVYVPAPKEERDAVS